MVKYFSIFILYILSFFSMHAQTRDSIAGEYYLQGVMETASGFQLLPDSSFQFFYSYGAVDRYGSGKWSLQNGHVILNSKKKPESDFTLVKTRSTKNPNVTIKINHPNSNILGHFECTVISDKKLRQLQTNPGGIAVFPLQKVDSIYLLFQFCPDRYSSFAVPDNKNYFEFKLEPSIAEVFFEEFILSLTDSGLSGGHPLLQGGGYRYVKNN
ncbi:MAG: hypothetical protein C5B52_10505 [Bacteroidetes bacterium]|nr:MAG: hypothetical protein C5B52_10505 [Bacteroidota bacterium]